MEPTRASQVQLGRLESFPAREALCRRGLGRRIKNPRLVWPSRPRATGPSHVTASLDTTGGAYSAQIQKPAAPREAGLPRHSAPARRGASRIVACQDPTGAAVVRVRKMTAPGSWLCENARSKAFGARSGEMMGRSRPALPNSPDFGAQRVVGHRGGANGRVGTTYGASGLRPHRGDQRCDAKDVHDAGEI
jgi:hypothetical protein